MHMNTLQALFLWQMQLLDGLYSDATPFLNEWSTTFINGNGNEKGQREEEEAVMAIEKTRRSHHKSCCQLNDIGARYISFLFQQSD